jgi:hypothetical protein
MVYQTLRKRSGKKWRRERERKKKREEGVSSLVTNGAAMPYP